MWVLTESQSRTKFVTCNITIRFVENKENIVLLFTYEIILYCLWRRPNYCSGVSVPAQPLSEVGLLRTTASATEQKERLPDWFGVTGLVQAV